LLLSWLAVVGDPLCFAAGWLRMNVWLSALFIGAGKAARYAVILFLAWRPY
jgi:membrane protein YqaA with SNARE-associated domain